MRPTRAASSMVLACLLLAGCSSKPPGNSSTAGSSAPAGTPGTTTPADRSTGSIPVGAGPQQRYTVQQQPPAGSCHYRYKQGEPLEDPKCTPGAISPAVTQANLKSTICRTGGYTSGIRPPESVTSQEKKLNAASYGYTGRLGDAEHDHLLSGVAAVMSGI